MVGGVVDLRHAGCWRGVRGADQRSDGKGGDEEHRSEDAKSDGRGPPVREPAPQLDQHRHGCDQAENAEERSTTGTCHERGPHQWPDAVQHVRCQADDPPKNAAEHRPNRSTLPIGRPVGRVSDRAVIRSGAGIWIRGGESMCGSHPPRLGRNIEGAMQKQPRLD